ncbi:hypothetical protein PS1M3_35220 [Pseudoalteromonas sp. PS1M3]|uniref:hypothetical protein n=1 Tax=Pseudoalteromonas sp. PS1M3 TaxID=87791 RepID=UPI001950830E|nr:hypothetical protein [Pseudoalteromonas sp. PS1M3]BBW93435.1 hypothetical protein PS1M3_35220 [Pseudoalteromonas sp. PS1M3]
MKKVILAVAVLISSISHASENAKSFFDEYTKLGSNFDVKVASLYANDAKIHSYRVYPHGKERQMEITGEQWKVLVQRVMPLAKMKNDKSTFKNIAIKPEGNGYKIKAHRYSEKKCYTDKGYYMLLKRTEKGQLEIVEEYMETQPQSDC